MNDNTVLGAIIGGALVWWYLTHRARMAANGKLSVRPDANGSPLASFSSGATLVDAAGYPVSTASNPCGSY